MEPGVGERSPDARGQRSSADLDEHPVQRRRPATSLISQPRVRPPSSANAFSGPCTPNGTAPAATASRNRCTQGSPGGSSSRRGQIVTSARSRCNASSTTGSAHGGTKTSSSRRSAAASVAAASAALPHEAMARRLSRPPTPSASAALRWSRIEKRWRALWLPATFPVSSLTHTPPSSVNPSASRESVGPIERRDPEADPVHRGDPFLDLADQGVRSLLGHPVRERERLPGQLGAEGDEGVRIVHRPEGRETADDPQDVVTVRRRGPGAAPGRRSGDVHLGAADGAAVAQHVGRRAHPSAATRALKSTISSSQTGR